MEIDWKKKYNETLEKIKGYTTDKYGCTRLKPTDIFPELAESEDEKIRKEIVSFIRAFWVDHRDSVPQTSKWLDWLEKQKINTEGDFGRGYDCGYQAGYAVAMNEMKPKVATATLDSEKQKEQKPRWEINNPHTTKWTREMIDEKFEELVEPKPEWSEDERIRSALLRGFNSMLANQPIDTFYGEPIKDIIAYFEKQKDSPMPEDTVIFQKGVAEGRRLEREDMEQKEERRLTAKDAWCYRSAWAAVRDSDAYNGEEKEHILRFLQRCEQKHFWKPSEEQMRVFFKATPVNLMPEELAIYQSLYEDLEKLM